jgi:hypothetical protein
MSSNPRSLWIPSITTGVLTWVCLAGPIATATAQDRSTELTVVADKVRSQRIPCNNPSSAQRVEAQSAPNQTVYLLKCEGVTYRVLLIPDQAAEVSRVD